MASKTDFQSFLLLVSTELRTIPRAGLLSIGVVNVASAAWSLVLWTHRPDLLPLDYVMGSALLIAWVVMLYAVSMLMIDFRFSVVGLGKFIMTSLVMAMPLILSLGVLFFSVKAGNGLAFVTAFALLASSVVLSLLPGWPILQATSPQLIGPWNALKATKGLRWPLVFMSFLLSGIDRVIPEVSSTEDFSKACALAGGGFLVACLSTTMGLSIAVAAWRLMKSETAPPVVP